MGADTSLFNNMGTKLTETHPIPFVDREGCVCSIATEARWSAEACQATLAQKIAKLTQKTNLGKWQRVPTTINSNLIFGCCDGYCSESHLVLLLCLYGRGTPSGSEVLLPSFYGVGGERLLLRTGWSAKSNCLFYRTKSLLKVTEIKEHVISLRNRAALALITLM